MNDSANRGWMTALVRDGGTVAVRRVPRPQAGIDHVVVRVLAVGVCRTDLQVASGELKAADPVVLGHELAGEIVDIGPGVDGLRLGDRVSAVPWRLGGMLGVELDGAFATHVRLHEDQIVPLPAGLPWRLGAYVEPVAAALGAVLDPLPAGRVLVLGTGRIGELAARVLRVETGAEVVVTDDPIGEWDVVIEARPDPGVLRRALEAVRPGGRVVLKSRADVDLALPLRLAIAKRATLHPVGHGSFARAAALLASGDLDVHDLLGRSWPLAGWREAFAAGEGRKAFIEPIG